MTGCCVAGLSVVRLQSDEPAGFIVSMIQGLVDARPQFGIVVSADTGAIVRSVAIVDTDAGNNGDIIVSIESKGPEVRFGSITNLTVASSPLNPGSSVGALPNAP